MKGWKPHNESPYFNGLMHGIVIGVFLCVLAALGGYISRKPLTLEITYRDSVAIDSTVVYKMKK